MFLPEKSHRQEGVWWATVHGVTNSWTWLSYWTTKIYLTQAHTYRPPYLGILAWMGVFSRAEAEEFGSSLYSVYNCDLYCAVLRHSVMSNSLQPHELQPSRLLCPWEFSRQAYWSGLPCPPPGDLLNPGIESQSPTLQVNSWPSEPPGKRRNALYVLIFSVPLLLSSLLYVNLSLGPSSSLI